MVEESRGQSVHVADDEAPISGEYLPISHWRQDDDPDAAEYFPAGHCTHSWMPLSFLK